MPSHPNDPTAPRCRRRRIIGFVVCGVAALALVACGSDDDGETGASTTTTTTPPDTGLTTTTTAPDTGPPTTDVPATTGDSPTTSTPPDTTTTPTTRPESGSVAPPRRVDAAIADLAKRLDVQSDAVSVAVDEAVDWSDGSIGCPQKGTMYPQVVTPGYRLILESGGSRYAYHAARDQPFFYCATPDADGTVSGGAIGT